MFEFSKYSLEVYDGLLFALLAVGGLSRVTVKLY